MNASPEQEQPGDRVAGHHSVSLGHHRSWSLNSQSGGSCIQEWTGSAWVIAEVISCADDFKAQSLDPAEVRGTYVGERVVTPCVKL
jgi:hypothetical protein